MGLLDKIREIKESRRAKRMEKDLEKASSSEKEFETLNKERAGLERFKKASERVAEEKKAIRNIRTEKLRRVSEGFKSVASRIRENQRQGQTQARLPARGQNPFGAQTERVNPFMGSQNNPFYPPEGRLNPYNEPSGVKSLLMQEPRGSKNISDIKSTGGVFSGSMKEKRVKAKKQKKILIRL
jgi:hypothetical protein